MRAAGLVLATLAWARLAEGAQVVVASPDKRLELVIGVQDGRLTHAARLSGSPVIETSPLGLSVDGEDLGVGATLGPVERFATNQRFAWRGVHAEAIDRSNGARIRLKSAKGGAFTLEARAFDDAVAFRFVVPGSGSRVPDAATSFRIPAGSTVWYHGARDHYEGLYSRKRIEDAPEGDWAGPPLTFRLPADRGYASISEAALVDHAGMMLQADGRSGFRERLGHAVPASYPYTLRYGEDNAKRLSVAAAIEGTITTPWRVVLIGSDLNALVNSDAIASLSPPADPKLFPQGMKTDWLRPGRAVWRYLDGGEPSFEGIREFSKLAGELGFEHHVVEGQWRRWSDEQIRELVAYSKERGVSLWFWIHSKDQRVPGERRALFARLRDLGIAGVKVDFFDHEAKELIDLYQAMLRDAAENRLLVNFHGANKPAGEARTWPNEMTREGIRGLEYRSTPAFAEHNTTVPFARFLAGAADYTPLVFGDRRKDTTWAHQIATLVVFTSPVMIHGAHPQSVLDNPAADLIRSIPSVWDETRVLAPSEVGELAVFARRSGDTWFLGALNGKQARTLRVSLSFLGAGSWYAKLVKDTPGRPAAVEIEERRVSGTGTIDIALAPAGGLAARFAR